MDSDESRPESSNSARSWQQNESGGKTRSRSANSEASQNSNRASRRRESQSSDENSESPRSDSESSSSSSSDNENNDDDGGQENSASEIRSPRSSRNSSSKQELPGSRQQSLSPVNSSAGTLNRSRSNSPENPNISRDDLSEISDIESDKKVGDESNSSSNGLDETRTEARKSEENGELNNKAVGFDLRQKLDKLHNQENNGNLDDLVGAHDEDALDFEAEEGECQDFHKDEGNNQKKAKNDENDDSKTINDDNNKAKKDEEELEEGEVSDEDEKRPEETEPKPVCRFYTRGQCTWGMSCRFLHPGVTDKGNYTMFDLVRPVPLPPSGGLASRPGGGYGGHPGDFHEYRTERPPIHTRAAVHPPNPAYTAPHDHRSVPDGPVMVESAWERGLRTAKEMMRKANKRKEQDTDFEEKKMNLALSPDEIEKEQYYAKERASPPESGIPFGRHPVYPETHGIYSPPERFNHHRPPPPSVYDDIDPYGRTARYRELPPHRMPHYEDEKRVRPAREVIVQRVEPSTRGDEWNDPWMRSKSPGLGHSRDRLDKRRRDHRSYSSNSSYSSSSSSHSDSSSDSSRSPTPYDHKRRYATSRKSPTSGRRHEGRSVKSPSPTARRSRRSPSFPHSPVTKKRGQISSSTLDKRAVYGTISKTNKTPPAGSKSLTSKSKHKRRHSSSSSGSGSSDSSMSESESDSESSSSDSSSLSRNRTPPKKAKLVAKSVGKGKLSSKQETVKKRSPISIELKKPTTIGTSALTSPPAHGSSNTNEKETKKSRREELLKQLRAVEDAIAKKRSKLA